MNELLPCPFCDGEASISNGEFLGKQTDYVECLQCAASSDMKFSKQEVIDLWNNRPIVLTRTSDDYKRGFFIATDMVLRWCESENQTLDMLKQQIKSALLFNKYMEEKGCK